MKASTHRIIETDSMPELPKYSPLEMLHENITTHCPACIRGDNFAVR